jgi:hypothetical protein
MTAAHENHAHLGVCNYNEAFYNRIRRHKHLDQLDRMSLSACVKLLDSRQLEISGTTHGLFKQYRCCPFPY